MLHRIFTTRPSSQIHSLKRGAPVRHSVVRYFVADGSTSVASKPAGWDAQRLQELCAMSTEPLREFAVKIGVCAEGDVKDLAVQVLAAEDARSHWPDFTSDADMLSYKGPRMPSARVLVRSRLTVRPVTRSRSNEGDSTDTSLYSDANRRLESMDTDSAVSDRVQSPKNTVDQRFRDVPVINDRWVRDILAYMKQLKRVPKLYIMFVLRQALVLHQHLQSLVELRVPSQPPAGSINKATSDSGAFLSDDFPWYTPSAEPGKLLADNLSSRNVSRVTVVGDTHGQYFDLLHLLSPAVAGYPSPATPFVFNGDFVDRGIYSFETIFALLAMKVASPQSVHLLRGNHETTDMNAVYGFEKQILGKYDSEVLNLFRKVFQSLPVAATINKRVFIAHGGIGKETSQMSLSDIAKLNRFVEPNFPSALSELLWSDPNDRQPGLSANTQRGAGWAFGENVTSNFLKKNGLELIVRSHEARQEGFSVHHGGRCVTVFSAPNYCDSYGNLGAVVIFERAADQDTSQVDNMQESNIAKNVEPAAVETVSVRKDMHFKMRVTTGDVYTFGQSSPICIRDLDASTSVFGQEPLVTKVLQFEAVSHPLSPRRGNSLRSNRNS